MEDTQEGLSWLRAGPARHSSHTRPSPSKPISQNLYGNDAGREKTTFPSSTRHLAREGELRAQPHQPKGVSGPNIAVRGEPDPAGGCFVGGAPCGKAGRGAPAGGRQGAWPAAACSASGRTAGAWAGPGGC